jgi:uncharacterized protein (DUF2336 family)
MFSRNFLQESQNAPSGRRADHARALARAYIHDELAADQRGKAAQIFFALLDDPSPLVRRALAESLAGATTAPPGVVLGLACDQSDVAASVLSRSPVLTDAQLIDCAAIGDSAAQTAIALRAEISPALAAALAEIGSREALIALAVNEGANLPDFALRRMIERFGADARIREALLSRAWLPAAIRAALAAAAARQLSEVAAERGWLTPGRSERLAKETSDRAFMIIAAGCAGYSDETASLAAYLRVSGQLTAGLALRALLCGQTGLFEATLVELTGRSPRRIADLIKTPASTAFAAVFAEAGLPEPLRPAFETALAALARLTLEDLPAEDCSNEGALQLPIIQAVLRRCESAGDEAFSRLVALLRRFETEAAREKGRRSLDRLKRQAALDARVETTAGAAPADVVPAEPQVVIDLTALEKELVAA